MGVQTSVPTAASDRKTRVSTSLESAAGWMIVSAVAAAPLALGARPPHLRQIASAWLLIAAAVWIADALRRRRRPRLPLAMVLAIVWLLMWGWTSVFNARSAYNPVDGTFAPLRHVTGYLPSTFDAGTSAETMIQITAVLVVLACLVDLYEDRRWQLRAMRTVAVAGTIVILIGLLGRAGVLGFWHAWIKRQPFAHGIPFGTFDYQGNAGTYINLVIPALVFNWVNARATPGHARRGLPWLVLLGFAYLALFANASRAALMIGITLGPWVGYAVWRLASPPAARPAHIRSRKRLIVICFAVTLIALLVLAATGGAYSIERLKGLREQLLKPSYPRYREYRVVSGMIGQEPLAGFGVGTYKLLSRHRHGTKHYDYAPPYVPGAPDTAQHHVMQDYLQTLVEWGVLGTAGWAVLIGGAFVALCRHPCRALCGARVDSAATDRTVRPAHYTAALALCAIYLHAAVDCPLQLPALQVTAVVYLAIAWHSMKGGGADRVAPSHLQQP